MKKYICIDTNVYIQCCLLEIEGDDIDSLKRLHDLLDKEELVLLLPEVINLELKRKLIEKFEELTIIINSYKEGIQKDSKLGKKFKKDITQKLDECLKEREINKQKVQKEIENIFDHKNTKKIPITNNLLVDSYKYSLTKEKPFKIDKKVDNKIQIQSDCLIVESLLKFFENEKSYRLFFCSNNKVDFAQNEKDKVLKIHDDIRREFEERHGIVEYYDNLLCLFVNLSRVIYKIGLR